MIDLGGGLGYAKKFPYVVILGMNMDEVLDWRGAN